MTNEKQNQVLIVSPEEAMRIMEEVGQGAWRSDEISVDCEALSEVSHVVDRSKELNGRGVWRVLTDTRPGVVEKLRIGFRAPDHPLPIAK